MEEGWRRDNGVLVHVPRRRERSSNPRVRFRSENLCGGGGGHTKPLRNNRGGLGLKYSSNLRKAEHGKVNKASDGFYIRLSTEFGCGNGFITTTTTTGHG